MITIFDDLVWPVAATYGSGGGPEFRTEIELLDSGGEAVNALWDRPRRRWRASVGRRLAPQLETLDAFFEIVAGRGYGFRFEDPLLNSTGGFGVAPTATDQFVAELTAERAFRLRLTRSVGSRSFTRRIFRPVAGTVALALDGAAVDPADFTLDHATGRGAFAADRTGTLTAGFRFHFAARIDADRLETSLEGFRNGTAAALDLVEIREFDA